MLTLLGVKGQHRSLTFLHAELEAFLWAMNLSGDEGYISKCFLDRLFRIGEDSIQY